MPWPSDRRAARTTDHPPDPAIAHVGGSQERGGSPLLVPERPRSQSSTVSMLPVRAMGPLWLLVGPVAGTDFSRARA